MRTASAIARHLAPFPQNLTKAELRSVEALIRFGTPSAVAKAYDINVITVRSQLQRAREKAGVHNAMELAVSYLGAPAYANPKPALQEAWELYQQLRRASR